MYQSLLAVSVILAAVSLPAAFAESEAEKIIYQCETIYPELETLGKTKFLERYGNTPNIRSCLTLYNDINWFSDGPDRTDRLIALLGGPIIEKDVRDRYTKTETIPQWIKEDATRWQQGQERDNIFSYGVRYMINSKMIDAPISITDQAGCTPDQICLEKNDYIKYSIKDSQDSDVTNLTHTFGTPGALIAISSVEVTKSDKTLDNFHIDSSGFIDSGKQYYRFVHKTPLEVGTTVDSVYPLTITSDLVFPYKNQKRDAVLALDKTRQYQEVIDKNTGIVLFAKFHDRIKKTDWSAELTDTNAFSNDVKIQYKGMNIPSWFKNPVKWWAEGRISDEEYLASLSYLLQNKIMQI